MKLDYPITIISDLHVGHPASFIKDPEQLAPLFRDAAAVVFNGDSVEQLWLINRDKAHQQAEEIGKVCVDQGARPVFLNGNHDPVISSASLLDLADGNILVTHGDVLFHEVAPWSREGQIIADAHNQVLQELDEQGQSDLTERLVAIKRASLALEMHEPKRPGGRLAGLRTAIREGFPPWRAFRIIYFWMKTPGLARELAYRYRPKARFVIIGHTHYAGVWDNGQRVVINTGSFLPFSGRYIVRLESNRIEVRKIDVQGGKFHIAGTKATLALQQVPVAST
jgi:UDP-2,3-diacylglucosamine pyrophosphatase LpxH